MILLQKQLSDNIQRSKNFNSDSNIYLNNLHKGILTDLICKLVYWLENILSYLSVSKYWSLSIHIYYVAELPLDVL